MPARPQRRRDKVTAAPIFHMSDCLLYTVHCLLSIARCLLINFLSLQKPIMLQRPPIRYAIIALAVTLVWIIIEHLAGWNTTRHDIGQYTRMLPMIFFWVLIFVGINQSRGQRRDYTFNEGFRDGLMMSLLYCAGFTIMILIYQKFFNPEFFDTLKAYTLEQLKAKNESPEKIEQTMKSMEMSFNGSALSFFLLFVFSFGWSLIVSAIAAVVYRTKRK